MNILSLENISKTFGFKPLVDGATFGLDATDKAGLIGANGSGKTTLLRIIAGEEQPDAGRVVVARDVAVGYLSQNPSFDPEETVLDAVFPSTSEAMRLLHDYELATAEVAASGGDEKLLERVAELTDRIGDSGGWDLEANARIVLSRLGISDTRAKMSTLSGGQKKRVALARALVARPDLLILDEPTNHLDAETVEWLEGYLDDFAGALLVVTHDRYFLDRVTRRILEVDRGQVRGFDGNYAFYLERRAEIENARETADRRRATDLRRELAWLQRGARARTTKEKARVQRVAELQSAPKESVARQEVDISVATHRLGKKILELDDVSKGYDGRALFDGFTYTMKRRDRIGVLGANGTGKTTLLDVVAGRTAPDRGSVALGETVVVGYYDQETRDFPPEQRAIDYVSEVAGRVETADGSVITAGQMLERFLFPPDMQYAPIGKFSGGERRRLFLVRVLMAAPNVLLLDEPTNDLDIETLARLEEYLDSFPGCLVVVSHDRYFLDRTIEHVFHFEGDGQVRGYAGAYTAFREAREREAAETSAREAAERDKKSKPVAAPPPADGPRKLSFKERAEMETLESKIEAAEARKIEIETEVASAGSDHVQLLALTRELQELDAALTRDVERWGELAERA